MAFKLLRLAEQVWRRIDALHLVALVRAGAKLEDGKLVESAPRGAAARGREVQGWQSRRESRDTSLEEVPRVRRKIRFDLQLLTLIRPLSRRRHIRSFSTSRRGERVEHSQTVAASQPSRRMSRRFLRSRFRVAWRFAAQNSARVAGMTFPYRQRCRCQKHP